MRQYQTDTLKPIREEYCKETVHRILCCSDHPFLYTEKRQQIITKDKIQELLQSIETFHVECTSSSRFGKNIVKIQ